MPTDFYLPLTKLPRSLIHIGKNRERAAEDFTNITYVLLDSEKGFNWHQVHRSLSWTTRITMLIMTFDIPPPPLSSVSTQLCPIEVRRCLHPVVMNSVFLLFKECLLAFSHLWTFSCGVGPLQEMFVSSANKFTLVFYFWLFWQKTMLK